MKRTLLTLLLLVGVFATIKAEDLTPKAEGTYTGSLFISLGSPIDDSATGLPNQTISIERIGENLVRFTLKNFSFAAGMELGDIVIDQVSIKSEGDKIKFATTAPKNVSFMGGAVEATVKINGDNSFIQGDSASIDVDVVWLNDGQGGSGTPIYVRFAGKKQTSAIENVKADRRNAKLYDLQGRPVQGEPKRGIFVRNGKKVILR